MASIQPTYFHSAIVSSTIVQPNYVNSIQPQPVVKTEVKAVDSTIESKTVTSAKVSTSATSPVILGQSVLEQEEVSDRCAYLVLRDVPVTADVYLVNMKMTARGSVRKYRIPVRLAATDYTYPIEIRLPSTGSNSGDARTVVRAGQTTELWVSQFNENLVLSETKTGKIETSAPLASR